MKRVLALCLLTLTAAAKDFAVVTPVQMPPHTTLRDAVYADVNGDGLRDLVLAAVAGEKPVRSLRIHLQRRKGVPFRAQPDHLLSPVARDAVAFAVGDVHGDPGAEVVLLSASSAWAWRPRAGEKERFVKLAVADFLWQLPDAHRLAAWPDALRDLDGDGLVDLVLPEPDGYRIVLQKRESGGAASFASAQSLVIPAGGAAGGPARSLRQRARNLRSRVSLRFTLGTDEGESAEATSGPLLDIDDTVPAPQFLDWEGDGDLDLLAATEERLFVFEQQLGRFTERPRMSFRLPVVGDRNRRLDVSYSAHVLDLNRDHRADCVMFAGDQRSEDVRTQVLFFVQGAGRGPSAQTKKSPLFGKRGRPQQLLVLSGFAGNPRFEDIDGDGYPDLMVGSVRPDLLDSLSKDPRIETELSVFLNRKGRLSRRPDLSHRTKVQAEGLRFARQAMMVSFFGDVTRDGVRDLLLRDEETRLRVLWTRRARDGSLSLVDKPLWELRIERRADVRVAERGGKLPPDLLVLEAEQILRVRFR